MSLGQQRAPSFSRYLGPPRPDICTEATFPPPNPTLHRRAKRVRCKRLLGGALAPVSWMCPVRQFVDRGAVAAARETEDAPRVKVGSGCFGLSFATPPLPPAMPRTRCGYVRWVRLLRPVDRGADAAARVTEDAPRVCSMGPIASACRPRRRCCHSRCRGRPRGMFDGSDCFGLSIAAPPLPLAMPRTRPGYVR